MRDHSTRRDVLRAAAATALFSSIPLVHGQARPPIFSLPVGWPDHVLGDGFLIRHGYATENTWFNPGWLHAGEDWYVAEGDTAGASVYAIGDGEVVYAGAEYPGRVVIIQHSNDLFSMYGHLDYALAVNVGEEVERGQLLGTVLARTDGQAPSHLHFEVRNFLTTPEVNGNAPRYDYGCGYHCPPGPGYWPIGASEHPSELGWRNPTHVIARRIFADATPLPNSEVIVARTSPERVLLWSSPSDFEGGEELGHLQATPGDRYPLLAVVAGREASEGTSAETYELWYRIAVPDAPVPRPWVRAAIPDETDTGSDGRPSSIRFDFLPVAEARS